MVANGNIFRVVYLPHVGHAPSFSWIELMLISKYRAYLAAFGLGLLVLAWSDKAAAAREPAASSWVLKQGRDIPSPQPRKPELRMEGAKLSGTTGCNNFTATLSEEPNKRVAIKQVALTRMLCEGKQNAVETAFVRALEQTQFISRQRRSLTFLSAEKTPLLVWQSRHKPSAGRLVRTKKVHRRPRAYRRAAVRARGCPIPSYFARMRFF